jgi:hypothetical protein
MVLEMVPSSVKSTLGVWGVLILEVESTADT